MKTLYCILQKKNATVTDHYVLTLQMAFVTRKVDGKWLINLHIYYYNSSD